MERLTADVDATTQNSADATIIIGDVLHDITMNEAEMQNATDLRQTERVAFEKISHDYTEYVSALESATRILKTQPANVA